MSFRILGCKISVDFFFFLALALAFYGDNSGLLGLSLLCAAAHEMGHILAMLLCATVPTSISFGAFGACICCPQVELTSAAKRCFIYLCGPAVNALLCLAGMVIFGNGAFVLANFSLAAFNLLPILPLDGAKATGGRYRGIPGENGKTGIVTVLIRVCATERSR